ncbi:hypothetical protein FQN57_005145 [Myotisia sp. PD_48]|nr:hypothetical protein FQN57_005145 [Myotisia sp. PD_48]
MPRIHVPRSDTDTDSEWDVFPEFSRRHLRPGDRHRKIKSHRSSSTGARLHPGDVYIVNKGPTVPISMPRPRAKSDTRSRRHHESDSEESSEREKYRRYRRTMEYEDWLRSMKREKNLEDRFDDHLRQDEELLRRDQKRLRRQLEEEEERRRNEREDERRRLERENDRLRGWDRSRDRSRDRGRDRRRSYDSSHDKPSHEVRDLETHLKLEKLKLLEKEESTRKAVEDAIYLKRMKDLEAQIKADENEKMWRQKIEAERCKREAEECERRQHEAKLRKEAIEEHQKKEAAKEMEKLEKQKEFERQFAEHAKRVFGAAGYSESKVDRIIKGKKPSSSRRQSQDAIRCQTLVTIKTEDDDDEEEEEGDEDDIKSKYFLSDPNSLLVHKDGFSNPLYEKMFEYQTAQEHNKMLPAPPQFELKGKGKKKALFLGRKGKAHFLGRQS